MTISRVGSLSKELETEAEALTDAHVESRYQTVSIRATDNAAADTLVSGNSVGALGSADSKQAQNRMTENVNVSVGKAAKVIAYGNVSLTAESKPMNMPGSWKAPNRP